MLSKKGKLGLLLSEKKVWYHYENCIIKENAIFLYGLCKILKNVIKSPIKVRRNCVEIIWLIVGWSLCIPFIKHSNVWHFLLFLFWKETWIQNKQKQINQSLNKANKT